MGKQNILEEMQDEVKQRGSNIYASANSYKTSDTTTRKNGLSRAISAIPLYLGAAATILGGMTGVYAKNDVPARVENSTPKRSVTSQQQKLANALITYAKSSGTPLDQIEIYFNRDTTIFDQKKGKVVTVKADMWAWRGDRSVPITCDIIGVYDDILPDPTVRHGSPLLRVLSFPSPDHKGNKPPSFKGDDLDWYYVDAFRKRDFFGGDELPERTASPTPTPTPRPTSTPVSIPTSQPSPTPTRTPYSTSPPGPTPLPVSGLDRLMKYLIELQARGEIRGLVQNNPKYLNGCYTGDADFFAYVTSTGKELLIEVPDRSDKAGQRLNVNGNVSLGHESGSAQDNEDYNFRLIESLGTNLSCPVVYTGVISQSELDQDGGKSKVDNAIQRSEVTVDDHGRPNVYQGRTEQRRVERTQVIILGPQMQYPRMPYQQGRPCPPQRRRHIRF